MRRLFRTIVAVAMGASTSSFAASVHEDAERVLCADLEKAVAAQPGDGPLFLQSYRPGPNEGNLPQPLEDVAFVYDNALAVIALLGCGERTSARRIGDAILLAQDHDRFYRDGRLRNAYRSGPLQKGAAALPGWWDADAERWREDAYQAGSAVGNVAWAALALLHLYEAGGEARDLLGAQAAARWIDTAAWDPRDPAGFAGGAAGFEPEPAQIAWKSTEHNVDVMALAYWLARIAPDDPRWARMGERAQGFVEAMHVPGRGFQIGTTPENHPAGFDDLVLDAQLWPPIALADPPGDWWGALDVARRSLSVRDGFDFNADRDGLWTEGTAQASLAFALRGDRMAGKRYLKAALEQREARTGWLLASAEPSLTTGLSVGPDGGEPFLYYRRPHLGATAWAALAALRLDPFLRPGAARTDPS